MNSGEHGSSQFTLLYRAAKEGSSERHRKVSQRCGDAAEGRRHTPGPAGPSPTRPRRPWPWIALAVVMAVAIAGAVAWQRTNAARSPALEGGVLTPPVSAFDFRLPDQDGHPVALSDLRGKVVVLTFLYTHCPDVCPLIAEQLRTAREQLGEAAGSTAFVAVSVDPAGDTPAAIREFLKRHRVEGQLTYARGTFAQLRPVWAHYFVGSDAAAVQGTAITTPAPAPGQVGHTAVVYVIDPAGQIRVFLPGNFDPKDLVTDIRALAPRR